MIVFIALLLLLPGSLGQVDPKVTQSLLYRAIVQGNATSAVRGLLPAGLALEQASQSSHSPSPTAIHLAAYRGRLDLVRLLERNGARLKATAVDKNTPGPLEPPGAMTSVHFALKGYDERQHFDHCARVSKHGNFTKTLRGIVSKEWDASARDGHGRTALHYAVYLRYEDAVGLLSNSKRFGECATSTATGASYNGWNALHFAVSSKNTFKTVATLLLKHDGAPSPWCGHQDTHTHNTFATWKLDFPQDIVEDGARVVTRDKLFPYISALTVRLLRRLFKQCPALRTRITSRNTRGWSALHMAADVGDADAVALLLRSTSDLHSALTHQTQQSDSPLAMNPLHIAVVRNFDATLKAMACVSLERNAHASLVSALSERDSFNRSAIDLSRLLHSQQQRRPVRTLVDQILLLDNSSLPSSLRCDHSDFSTVILTETPLEMDSLSAPPAESIPIFTSLPSPNVLWRDHISLQRPFILRGIAHDWHPQWTLDYLNEHLGSETVRVGLIPYARQYNSASEESDASAIEVPMTFRAFTEQLRLTQRSSDNSNDDDRHDAKANVLQKGLYLFDNQLVMRHRMLMRDVHFPEPFRSRRTHPWQLMVGGVHTGAPFHFHLDAINVLFEGEKHWSILEAKCAVLSKRPVREHTSATDWQVHLLPACTRWEGVQRAGDLVYVPDALAHSVLNAAAVNVAVAVEVVM